MFKGNRMSRSVKVSLWYVAANVNVTNATFHSFSSLPIQQFTYTVVSSCKACYFDKNAFDPFTSVRKLVSDFRALPALGSLRSPLKTLDLVSMLKR